MAKRDFSNISTDGSSLRERESSAPDQRLIEFARALARQAARESWDAQSTDTASEAPPS